MKNRALRSDERCAHCPLTRAEHAQREAQGVVHHKFSTDGDFAAAEKKPSTRNGRVQRGSGKIGGPLGDPILRFLLVQKGLITPEEIAGADEVLRSTGALGPVTAVGDAQS